MVGKNLVRQVQSIAKAGSARLKGDVTLSAGSNVTLTQTDNDISIASTGGGESAVDSVNSQTGVVVLDQDDVGDGTTYKQYSSTEKTKLAGIETSADVTDTANVTSAGALMDSEVTNLAAVKSFDPTNYAAALGADDNYVTDAEKTVIGNTSGTNTGDQNLSTYQLKPSEGAFADGDKTKLNGIEAGADVTDASNVASAGAVIPTGTPDGSKFLRDDGAWTAIPGGGDALTANPLSQFAATTSSQLKGVLSDETGSGAAVFATSPALVTPTGIVKGDVGLGNVDNTSDATKQAATLLAAYPVGSIYINTSNTNPGTFIGGTWTAFGAGRVPVGFDSGDTDFDTDEETGGAKTVATNVAVATQPTFTVDSHTHPLSSAGQALIRFSSTLLTMRKVSTASFANTAKSTIGSTSAHTSSDTDGAELAGTTDATAGTATTRTADVALTNNATSVQQKYIVVRMWKRTA